jgi:uncharacterized protein (TIGR02246 family)
MTCTCGDDAAIRNLISRTALTQDARDWDRHADCYVPDVEYVHPKGVIVGVDEVVARSRAALTPLDDSQHLIGTMVVEVDGDTAQAVSYFHAQHVRAEAAPSGGTHFVIAGAYRDTLRKVDGVWRIARREQSYSWRAGNAAVIVR